MSSEIRDQHPGPFYARFIMNDFGGEKEVVLIPDDLPLDAKLVTSMMKNVRMNVPNLIIEGVGSSVHPMKLLDDKEVDLIMRQNILGGTNDENDATKENRDMIREVMVNKISDVTSAILQALQETGSSFFAFSTWMITFDIFVTMTMDAVSGAAGGHVQGISTFHFNDETISAKPTKQIMQDLLQSSVPLDEFTKDKEPPELQKFDAHFDVGEPDKIGLRDAMFTEWYDHSCLVEDRSKLKIESKRWPTSQWCNPLAQTYFLFFCRKGSTGITMDHEKKVGMGWDPMMQRELVAPPGMVFIGGHSQSVKDSYKQCFEKAVPTLIIKYSGGLTNVYAMLLESLTKILDGDTHELAKVAEAGKEVEALNDNLSTVKRLAMVSPQKLLSNSYEQSAQDSEATIRVTIADVVKLLDMAKARPQVFQHTIKVFDPLTKSQSQALDLLSECISSTYVGLVSLGASSDDILKEAWMMRQAFEVRSKRLVNLFNFSEYAAAILTWFALVCASLKIASEHCEAKTKQPSPLVGVFCKDVLARLPDFAAVLVPKVLNALVVIVPLTTSFLQTLKSYFRFRQKWATATMASHEIESHIYQFRASTGRYAKHSSNTNDQEQEEETKKLSMESLLRHNFSTNLQRIYVQALASDFSHDYISLKAELEGAEGQSKVSPNEDHQTPLLGTSANDDGISQMTGDEYYNIRFQQLKTAYLAEAPVLTRVQQFMNVWILVGGCVASLLGAYHMTIWIPVVVGFTGMLQHLLAVHNGSAELAAVNRALGGLQSLSVQWKGLSRMDRRAPRFKEQMVTLTEQQHMQVIITKTGIGEFLRHGEVDEKEVDEKEQGANGQSMKKTRSEGTKTRASRTSKNQ